MWLGRAGLLCQLAWLWSGMWLSSAHVRLSFPPSSSLLDSFWSDGSAASCANATAGQDSETPLQAGSPITVEWTSSVPHSDGIRIELLNAADEVVASFGSFSDPFNISETFRGVSLPAAECPHCFLRLSQAASDISPDRFFYSCAAISILSKIPDGPSCLGRGARVNGVCVCDDGFSGHFCQHQVDCTSHADCGTGGSCGESPANSPSSRSCFCPRGRFGIRCEKESADESSTFYPSLYKLKQANNNKIYWRIIEDEIEFVLKYPGKAWAAIGWKPLNNADAKCMAAFQKAQSHQSLRKVEIKKIVEERQPAKGGQERSASVRSCGDNEEWNKCPEASRECEANCEWTADPDSIPTCDRQCGQARCVCKEGFVRASGNSTACVPFDACHSTERQECPANSTWAQCGTACEPSCANMYDTAPCPASCEKAACTCADNYVRYDGKCIYWGDCPDLDAHFVFDENALQSGSNETLSPLHPTKQSRPHSVVSSSIDLPSTAVSVDLPLLPAVCATNETINECGRICEAECETLLIREQCEKCASPGCACIQGYARYNGSCVYWGDCPGQNSSDSSRPSPKFRSVVKGSECNAEWRFPADCSGSCDYRASWHYMRESDEIEFTIETRMPLNSWTAIGFAESPSNKNADLVVMSLSAKGEISVRDMWSNGDGVPSVDISQDIAVPSPVGRYSDGILQTRFKRRRVGRDKERDVLFTDDRCNYLLFSLPGGKFDQSGDIVLNSSAIEKSDRRVCIRECQPEALSASSSSRQLPSRTPLGSISSSLPPPKAETKSCTREFRYPPGCLDPSCEYRASWAYNESAKDVRFEISSKDLGRWTGIGFSKNGEMSNADIYTGWVYEGKAVVTDRFAYGRQLPAIDPADRSDIYDVGGRVDDDIQTIWFRRAVVTKDGLTDLALDKCYFFLFPVGGGRVLARKSSDFHNPRTPIGYHDLDSPRISQTKICMCDESGIPIPEQPARVRRRRQTIPFNVPRNPFGEAEDITSAELVAGGQPMACADMVVATVDDGRARVTDMFSLATATPIADTTLGGKDSLTRVSAYYEQGFTTVLFRRKLQASEAMDHSIERGPMQLLWARGVDPESYRHITGGQAIKADPAFFSPTSFRYHGMDNRGTLTVDFFGDTGDHEETNGPSSDCRGSWVFPAGCSSSACQYSVAWESDGHTVAFQLIAVIEKRQWTALGFSPQGIMANSDVVVVSVLEDGKVTVIDEFMESYGRPSIDSDQDIFEVKASFVDGHVYANFSRDLATSDDSDVSLAQCQFFLYSPSAGALDRGGEVLKHSATPVASAGRICLSTCSSQQATQPATLTSPATTTTTASTTSTTTKYTTSHSSSSSRSSPPPPSSAASTTSPSTTTTTSASSTSLPEKETEQSSPNPTEGKKPTVAIPPLIVGPPKTQLKARYALKFRILNREFVPDLADPSSEYYKSFSKDVKTAVDSALAFKWKDVQMGKVLSYSKGSVIALVEVEARNSSPKPIEVKSVVEEMAVRGAVGGLSIESTTVSVQQLPVEEMKHPDQTELADASVLWTAAVVGVTALLLVAALSICACLCCRFKRSSHQFSPMGSTNGKCYSDIPYKADTNFPPYPTPAAYPYGSLNLSKKNGNGFDNKAYQHQRHFSQATTASTKQSPAPSSIEPSPQGIGETTYQEWFSKVASKPASQEHEECVSTTRRSSFASHPNDPGAYYTMGGTPRSSSRPF